MGSTGTIILGICVAAILGMGLTCEGYKVTSFSQLVPQEINGWKVEGKDETYNRDTIFDYMNGAGEIYRLYRFRELLVRRYTKVGEPDIIVELFDMGSSEDAFGIFTHESEGEDEGIGQGSEYRWGLFCMWKGKFFVCILAEHDTPQATKTIRDIAKTIDQAIKYKGEKPKLLDCLSPKGLMKKSIRYFHEHFCLNYHYFVADQNILNLNQNTEAVLARYQQEQSESYLLLVRYPNTKEAEAAFKRFIEVYMPEAKPSGIIQTQNSRWTGVEVKQNFVVVVFDALSKASVVNLMDAIKDRLEVKST